MNKAKRAHLLSCMKTDAINAILAQHLQSRSLVVKANAELKALEESNAEMVAALVEARHQFALMLDGDPEWYRAGRTEKVAALVDAALKKAGVI